MDGKFLSVTEVLLFTTLEGLSACVSGDLGGDPRSIRAVASFAGVQVMSAGGAYTTMKDATLSVEDWVIPGLNSPAVAGSRFEAVLEAIEVQVPDWLRAA